MNEQRWDNFTSASIGLTIARWRALKKLTLEKLADQCGISRNALQNIENGAVPRSDKVPPLCNALEISPNMLFTYEMDIFSGLDLTLVTALKYLISTQKQTDSRKQQQLANLLNELAKLSRLS